MWLRVCDSSVCVVPAVCLWLLGVLISPAQASDASLLVPDVPPPAASSQSARTATAAASPFAAGTSTIETAGSWWLESWNKNLATDRLLGGHVALGHTWRTSWQTRLEIELLRADLARSRDAFLLAGSGMLRRRLRGFGFNEPFFELGLGVTGATAAVPTRGTTFNFLLEAGGGISRPLTPRTSVVGGVRVWHLSNAGRIRPGANPDIEAVGGYLGLQWRVTD
jgi:hypothetical protein